MWRSGGMTEMIHWRRGELIVLTIVSVLCPTGIQPIVPYERSLP
jgi:hypothetical protein